MNFEHIIASMDMFNTEWKMISASQHTAYRSETGVNRVSLAQGFEAPFDARDVQKHYALLASRTAMDIHAAEEREREYETPAVAGLRWKY